MACVHGAPASHAHCMLPWHQQLLLAPVTPPLIASSVAGMQGSMDFALAFSVITTANSTVPVFTLNTTMALGVDVNVSEVSVVVFERYGGAVYGVATVIACCLTYSCCVRPRSKW